MGCSKGKPAKKDELPITQKLGYEGITQQEIQIGQIIKSNQQYQQQIEQLKVQVKAIESSKLHGEEINIAHEITELKKKTQFSEQRLKATEHLLQEAQQKLLNTSGNNGDLKVDDILLEERILKNENKWKTLENEIETKTEKITTDFSKSNMNIKKDIENLFEVAKTQQQLLEAEVERRKRIEVRITELETELRLSKEFQLIQQKQIEQLSLMVTQGNNNNKNTRNNNSQNTLLNESIESQKQRHLEEINKIHINHGFQWNNWQELEEFKWIFSQERKCYIHEILAYSSKEAAATKEANKVICTFCYQKYISLNKLFTQLQLNSK